EERYHAYVERRRATVQTMSVQEVQAAIRIGRAGITAQVERLEAAAERIEQIAVENDRRAANQNPRANRPVPPEVLPPVVAERQPEQAPAVDHQELERRVTDALARAGFAGRPTWSLSARPRTRATARDFLRGDATVRQLI